MEKNNIVIGNVVKELGFGLISFGENRWKWKARHFRRFRAEPYRWVNPHMMIVGGSGGGKSNACKVIVRALCGSGANVAILDPHNEYLGLSGSIDAEVYDASRNGINMFDTDGMTEKERASEITGMLKRNFRLGEVQGYTLYKCIMYTYRILSEKGRSPNIHDLIFTIKVFKKNARLASEIGVLESLERRLSLIDTGAFEKSAEMGKVMQGNSVFLLSGLHTPEAQSIYIEGFLRKVYSNMLNSEKQDRARLYVVIDEAEKLGDNPVIGKIAAEGRKYGIGLIAISQRAKLVDKDLRGNAAMMISFGIREPEELNYVANFISGGNESGRFTEVKKALRSMGRGYAIVFGSQARNPMIVRFNRNTADSENLRYRILTLARDGIAKEGLEGKLNGFDGNSARLAIASMLDSEEIKEFRIVCGKYSGIWYISSSHNSAEHDIAVQIISRHLASQGIYNKVYNNSYGPDIMAVIDGKRVAVEYETGSKGIESTKRMVESRAKNYSRTIIIVNDSHIADYLKHFEGAMAFSSIDSVDFRKGTS
ncbi:MAG: ATP-binding protein [Candidatus Micrarchaeaceae archaeon]